MPGGDVVGIPDRVGVVAEIEAEAGVEGAARRDVVHDEIHLVEADRCHATTVVSAADEWSLRLHRVAAVGYPHGGVSQPPKPPPPPPPLRR